MHHRFIDAVEKALGWSGPETMGTQFARGQVPDPEILPRLLTPHKLLDLIMRRSLNHPQFRCFQDGSEIHPGGYFSDSVTRRGQATRMANMGRLHDLLQSGCTLVLDELDLFDPAMEVTCRALQWWSRELVQVNAYLTTQDASGFALHWDDHDVLIVQVAGCKSWDVRAVSRQAPMYRDAAPNSGPSTETVWAGVMQPGDVMHIPRGYWHQATRNDQGDGFSLHLTFGFVKRTGVNWLAWLADQCRGEELFRRDLDRWGNTEQRAAQTADLTSAIARLAAELSPADFLAARERERPAARHVATSGLFGDPAAAVCVTEFPPLIEVDGDAVEVTAAGKKLTLTAKALPALRMFLDGAPADITEAGEITGVDAKELAAILIGEGLCAELTNELSWGYTGLVTSLTSSPTP